MTSYRPTARDLEAARAATYTAAHELADTLDLLDYAADQLEAANAINANPTRHGLTADEARNELAAVLATAKTIMADTEAARAELDAAEATLADLEAANAAADLAEDTFETLETLLADTVEVEYMLNTTLDTAPRDDSPEAFAEALAEQLFTNWLADLYAGMGIEDEAAAPNPEDVTEAFHRSGMLAALACDIEEAQHYAIY